MFSFSVNILLSVFGETLFSAQTHPLPGSFQCFNLFSGVS